MEKEIEELKRELIETHKNWVKTSFEANKTMGEGLTQFEESLLTVSSKDFENKLNKLINLIKAQKN